MQKQDQIAFQTGRAVKRMNHYSPKTLKKCISISSKAYKKMSIQGRKHVDENYNFENYKDRWINVMDEFIEKNGSWENRKNYSRWTLLEVA